jgi:hypothetical protein
VTYTQLGTTVVGGATTSIFASTAELTFGQDRPGITTATGKFYRAQIYSDLTETNKVLDVDCDAITDGSATSFTALTGQTVKINRSTAGRKSVAVPSRSLKKWDDPHVYLPGVAGNLMSVPDEAALDITGDIDIRVQVALNDWTPAAISRLAGKYGVSGQRSYLFDINTSGVLRLTWSSDGTTNNTFPSVATGITDGAVKWVRATLDVDNGASGNDIKFFLSDDGVTWTQLGSTVTTAGVASLFNSTALVSVGSDGAGGAPATGKFYRAVIYSDLTETTKVLDIDCSKAPTNFTAGQDITFLAETGQTVTLNSTVGSGMAVVPARFGSGGSLFLFGTDDYMDCVANWQHQLLDFDAQDSFTVLAVIREWNTGVSIGSILTKHPRSLIGQGYYLRHDTASLDATFRISDSVPTTATRIVTGVAGAYRVLAGVADRGGQSLTAYAEGNPSAAVSIASVGSLAGNGFALRIGRVNSGTATFNDMEFTAVAIFRRALTATEIRTITDYYTNRGY